MLKAWKASMAPAEKTVLWPCVKVSVCVLVVSSVVLVFYTAFFSLQFSWGCLDCGQGPVEPTAISHLSSSGPSAAPAPTDISHIVFGIGGSARTWQQRRAYSELWWRPGETRGYVWLDEEPAAPWPQTCPPYRISEDASRFGARASAARIARIVAESVRLGAEGVRWFVMGDDDTVFFTENLVAMLGKYDHEQMYYIGAPSESVEQDVMHSYDMAFGGGGFALSYQAAAALAENLDGCLARYTYFYGSDQRIQACLTELGVPLTREPGFHQVDLRGDTYGLLAAHPVAPLVSLHHLGYVKPIFPRGLTQLDALRILINASRFDQARTLQQSFCYERSLNWSVSVSWGYTVQIYPMVVHPHDLVLPLRTFQTWRSFKDGPFTFKTRQTPPQGSCEKPLLYFLDRVEEVREVRRGPMISKSEYTSSEPENQHGCNHPGNVAASKVKTVKVLAPKMDLDQWKNAPRRQCCETRRSWWGSSIEVRIRHCHPGEITSPP